MRNALNIRSANQVLCFLVVVAMAGITPATRAFDTMSGETGNTATTTDLAISADRFHAHIAYLAHDDLEGRGTGDDGIDLAAGYIAAHFASSGLKPGGPTGSYFQRFTIPGRPELKDDCTLKVEGASAFDGKLRTDFVPFGFSAMDDFSAEAVFVGYGCTNGEKSYDDYAGVDVRGKVAVMLRREPSGWGDGENSFSPHARFETKLELAEKMGAAAVVVVNQDPGSDGVDMLMPFGRSGDIRKIPAVHVSRDFMNRILAASGASNITDLQKKIDESGKPASTALAGITLSGVVSYDPKEIIARNVIGVLPGTGVHAHEHVVIGGHYDHLGIRRGSIYNGADDNASGTAGVIELARFFAKQPKRERSIIFMAFSGEEIGLEGSQFFAKNPTVPITSIVSMINMDMIGRLDSDREENMLAIHGLGTGSSFKSIVEKHTGAMKFKFLPDDSAIGPSDHDSFYHAGIPSLFFFTGVHDDYHQPGDDIEKVNFAGAVQIVDLVARIAVDLVNDVEAPAYAKVDQPAKIFRSGSGSGPGGGGGVVIGVMPDADDPTPDKGWRISLVMPSGGAAKAGMKSGDRIVDIDGKPIKGFEDYRAATREKKPGDVINVKVLRDKEELTLSVELAARGARQ